MKFIIDNFDFYGSEFKINFKGKPKMNTTIGCMTSISTVILIFISCSFFIGGLFDRGSFSLIYNENEKNMPITNLSNTPILISVFSNTGAFISPNSTYELYAIYTKYEISQDSSGKKIRNLSKEYIKLEKCNSNHLKNNEKYFENIEVNNFFCIAPDVHNLTFYGTLTDLVTGFSFLNFYVSKCDNTKGNCDSDEVINKKLEQAFFTVAFLSYEIDHYDYEIPCKIKVQTSAFTISNNLVRRYLYYLDNVHYISDNGLFYQNLEIYNFYKFSNYEVEYDFSFGTNNLINSTYYSVTSIRNSEHIKLCKRTYPKIQLVIANIGGIIKLIMTVSQLIIYYITYNMNLQELSNSVFHFKEKENYGNLKIPNKCTQPKIIISRLRNENNGYNYLILELQLKRKKFNLNVGSYWLENFVFGKMKD